MKIPERVVEAAVKALNVSTTKYRVPIGSIAVDFDMKAAITAALQEWIASGEAFDLGANPNGKKHLLIRMEPDND